MLLFLLLLFAGTNLAIPIQETEEDGASSRKILGSSVVTSVSVIMDAGGAQTHFSDAVGRPVAKPHTSAQVASPIDLLNPDRYEFYTFDDSGDLVKRLMTLDEIQGIIASSDGELLTSYNAQQQAIYMPEKKVNDVVNNVQNVLKEEIESHRNSNNNNQSNGADHPRPPPLLDTPDVSATWSMILPAVFGNSGEDIKFDQAQHQSLQQTPETIVLDNDGDTVPPPPTTTTTTKKPLLLESASELLSQLITQVQTETEKTNLDTPVITVAIVSRRPTPAGSLEVLNDGTEQYISSIKPLDEETTNKFLQIFKPPLLTTDRIIQQQQQQKKKVPSTTTTTTEFPNKFLAVFLPPQLNVVEGIKNMNVHIKPTTFRPSSPYTKGDQTRKPSPFFKPPPTTTPEPVLIRKPSSQSPLNTLPATLADFIKHKLTTYHGSTTTTTVEPIKKYSSPGAQFVVQDQFIKSSTAKRRVSSTTTPAPISSTTTSTTTTTPKPPVVEIIPHSTPPQQQQNNDELISSSSSYYGGSTLPSHYSSSTNKNKGSFNTHYASTATQVLETITKKVSAVSAALLDKISATTLAADQLPTATTFYPDISTTLDYSSTIIDQQGSTEAQIAEMTVPELLDKLLLSSTNIYNLNNELVHQKGTTPTFLVVPTSPTEAITTDRIDTITTSTEPNLLASIEELISQTINDPNNELIDRGETERTTLREREEEEESLTTTTEKQNDDDEQGPVSTYDLLNQSVGSLLSQVVNSDKQTLTTLSDYVSTTDDDDVMKRTIPANDISTILDRTDIPLSDKMEEFVLLSTPTTEEESLNSTISPPTTLDSVESTTSTEGDLIYTNKNLELLKTEASSYNTKDHQTTEEIADATEIFTKLETTTTDSVVVSVTTQAIPTTYRPLTKVPTPSQVITKPPTFHRTTPRSIISSSSSSSSSKISSSQAADDQNWKLVSTLAPNNSQSSSTTYATSTESKPPPSFNQIQSPKPVDLVPQPVQGFSLEDTTANLDKDINEFVTLCNELAFGFWNSVTTGISSARSVFVSPFAATSLLAMVFLGARGSTSGEMNEILRLDDMVTFNPHLIFKNVSESIRVAPKNGIATAVIARELYSDKSRGQLLNFYKERARQFYEGHVEEASFKEIGDVIRRRTNLIVKRETNGRIPEFVKDSSFTVRPPLAGVSVSIFQTDCTGGSTEGRDGELYFVVLPTIRQRRLIPVPATVYRTNFLAGYEPSLDATAVSIGSPDLTISTIFVIPGQQGIAAPGDGLARLEKHLMESAFKQNSWSRLLKSLIPRPGLEVQIPRFSHRSVINATVALKHMGLRDLFDADKADLRGLNGVANELYLSDIIQLNNFATCGEGIIGEQHHSEIYPATANRTFRRYRRLRITHSSEEGISSSEDDVDLVELSKAASTKPLASASALVEALYLADEPRDYQRAFHDPLHDPSLLSLPLSLRPRQARIPEPPRLRFDRPFLYFVRHNPTGLVLHMGRFNPRLLP